MSLHIHMTSTIWRVFEAVRDLQALPEPQAGARAAELSAALGEHIEWTRSVVETALDVAPDDEVRRRLDQALEMFASVRAQIDRAVEEQHGDFLARTLELNFAGAAVQTRESPWELLSHETFAASPAPAAAVTAETTGDDLGPLHGTVFHADVVERAEALGRDPKRIFDFVVALEHALYPGHFRAPFEVLADGIGNAGDLAGLLVELLRASGIRARLVVGMIRMPLHVAAEWLGIADPAVLEHCLRDAGFTVMASSGSIDILPHVHVRALIGEAWVDLDAAVHPLDVVQPSDRTWTERPWDELAFLADTEFDGSPLAWYEQRLGATEPRVRRRAAPKDTFPPALPFEPLGFPQEQTTFAPDQEHIIGLQLVGPAGVLLEHRFATAGRCRERIALFYEPATPTAQALLDAAGSAVAAPAFALDLRPRLRIGETVIEGSAHAAAGTPLYMQITITPPGAQFARRADARPLCGTDWELVLEGPGSLLGPVAAEEPNTPLVRGARGWSDFPSPLLRAYHRRLARSALRIAALTGASGFSGPLVSMSAASLETFTIGGIAARRRPSSLLLDVKNIELRLYDSSGTTSLEPFVELFLCDGSHHEARVLLERCGLESMSTVEALRRAVRQENPLRVIRAEAREEVELLEHPPRVKRTLDMLLGISGRQTIIIPQRPVRFGAREMTAWIARGGPAHTSDYAIAGLSGGWGNDDDPKKPPKVRVVDLPKEKLTVVGQSIDYGAFAWDEDGNDYTSQIAWSSIGNLPGSGAGGSATYMPVERGTTSIMVSVGSTLAPFARSTGGGSTDFSNCVACDVKVTKLVFDESPELILIEPASKGGRKIKLGLLHYVVGLPQPSPAVIVAQKSTTATLQLSIGPLTSEPAQLKIEGKGRRDDHDLFTLHGERTVSKGFNEDIQLEVTGGDTIGIADVIEWKFTINSFDPLEEKTTVDVCVAADVPGKVPYHEYFYEIFQQACRYAQGKTPSDTEGILHALLYGRKGSTDLKFSYARNAGSFLEGLLRERGGHCTEMTFWMRALAAVHGIPGKTLQIGLVALEDHPGDKGWHWQTMRIALQMINNPDFDDFKGRQLPDLVTPGQYRKIGGLTDPTKLLPTTELGLKLWFFNTHKLAVFDVGGPRVYDASPHEIPEPFPLPFMGTVPIPANHWFRKGYLAKLMTYLIGIIEFTDGTTRQVMVLGEDVREYGEAIAVEFKYI